MSTDDDKNPLANRAVNTAAGIFFVSIALLVIVTGWEASPLGAALVALVIGGLGVEAIVAARSRRPSLLLRIGPLP